MKSWNGWEWLAIGLFAASMLWLSVIDWREQRLPRRIIYVTATVVGLLLFFVAFAVRDEPRHVGWMIAGGLGAWAVVGLMSWISRGGLGDGDVRLAGLIGLVLGYWGWRVVVGGLTAGFMLGAVGGLVLVASRRATMRSSIPFGPFLAAGAVVALLAQYPLHLATDFAR